jgi:hypothetical protein
MGRINSPFAFERGWLFILCGVHAAAKTAPGLVRRGNFACPHTATSQMMTEAGLPPLHAAALAGDLTRVRLLLSEGASLATADAKGFTALHHATKSTSESAPAVTLALLEAAAANESVSSCGASAVGDTSDSAKVVSLLAQLNAQSFADATEAVASFVAPDEDEVLRLSGDGLTLTKLDAALSADADGVTVLTGMFQPPKWATWQWAEETLCAGCLRLTSQFFAADIWKDADAAKRVRKSCGRPHGTRHVAAEATWPNRRFEYPPSLHGLTLRGYLTESAARTGLKHFASVPMERPHALLDALLQSALGPETQRWTRGAQRRILSIGAKAGGIQFHAHEPTWLALIKGLKVWWVGPAWAAAELAELGNNASAPAACRYLSQRPHPALRMLVQRPGDIVILGEFVSHATCNLEDSLAVGAQLGFYGTRHMDLRARPSRQWQGATICR